MMTFLALIVAPVLALADPDLQIQMVAEREVTVVEDGQEVTRRVPTLEIEPGAKLFFTLQIVNQGDEAASNVVVDNPIPEETEYVEGSAGGGNAQVLFSIDNGETWAAADELTYEFTTFSGEKETRRARPEMYTDVRWIMDSVPVGSNSELYFQVTVE